MIPSPVKKKLFSLIFLYEHLFVLLRKHLEVNESEYTFSGTKNKGEKLINLYLQAMQGFKCRQIIKTHILIKSEFKMYLYKDNIFT